MCVPYVLLAHTQRERERDRQTDTHTHTHTHTHTQVKHAEGASIGELVPRGIWLVFLFLPVGLTALPVLV